MSTIHNMIIITPMFLIFHLLMLVCGAQFIETQRTTTATTTMTTHLHFYLHDVVSGANPTAIRIAKAPVTSKSSTGFGATVMMDDPLTAEPDPSSTLVGRAQGIYALASLDEAGHLMMAMNLVFLDKENNGSTLAVFGRNSVFDAVREMPVISGSGRFRYARGFIHAKTHTFDMTTGDAVVEYNVTVFHQGQH